MAKREYTHAKGFNVTSLKGLSGIYIFQKACGELSYIGMCNNDFKNRINSHAYGERGKLNNDIQYIHVVIADPNKYPLHVLESLFIWYFDTPENYTYWLFTDDNDKVVKKQAKERNLHIRGSLEKFLLSFDCLLLERERDDNSEFKRYGEIEQPASKKVHCDGTGHWQCYKCLVNRRKEERSMLINS